VSSQADVFAGTQANAVIAAAFALIASSAVTLNPGAMKNGRGFPAVLFGAISLSASGAGVTTFRTPVTAVLADQLGVAAVWTHSFFVDPARIAAIHWRLLKSSF
jgi:hypothetical protein